jgi:hypothetical protein
MRRHGFTLILMLAAIASSGAAQKTAAKPETCEPEKLDRNWTVSAPVYRSCEVEREATLLGTAPAPNWDPSSARSCNLAVVEFVVDTLGVPEDRGARVVSTTTPSLANAVLRSIPQRRYSVATKDGHAVRQAIRDSITVEVVGGTLEVSEPMTQGRLIWDYSYVSRVPARAPSHCKPWPKP